MRLFSNRFAGAAIFLAALLLILGAPANAQADEFAAGNAALLDPFDPVPQIRFSDCYTDCGYRSCYDSCGYRRCYDRCGYRRHCCWHRHADGDFGRRLWTEDAVWWQRIYEHDFNTYRWNGAMQRYTNQADRYDHLMGWGPTGPHDRGPDPDNYDDGHRRDGHP